MPTRKIADSSRPDQAIAEIAGLVDTFCKQHLNAEYAELCRNLTDKLARKRPSLYLSKAAAGAG